MSNVSTILTKYTCEFHIRIIKFDKFGNKKLSWKDIWSYFIFEIPDNVLKMEIQLGEKR
jgi:hypothetical protein